MASSQRVSWTNGKKAARPAPAVSSERRKPLCQTRLDRISRPTATYHQAFFRWFVRLTDDPETYPARELKAHLQEELGPETARLKLEVSFPAETLTGEEWEALEDRLQRALGKMDALTRVLETRARAQPPLRKTRAPRLGSAPPSPCTESPDPFDVFAAE